MRELALGAVRREDLIETEKIRGVGLPLKLVAVAREAHTDLGFIGIAGLADARGSGYIFPGATKVRENVLEAVKGVLHAVLCAELPGGNVSNPGINGVKRADNSIVKMLTLPAQKISKTFAWNTHGLIILIVVLCSERFECVEMRYLCEVLVL